jgi:hypothetical protein
MVKPIEAPGAGDAERIILDDIISELFHDAQNGIHLVGMELELVSMGLGEKSDALKAGGMVTQLQGDLRDLRAYISVLQDPGASCDVTTVLEAVIAGAVKRKGDLQPQIRYAIAGAAPRAQMHAKVLTRIVERVLNSYEALLSPAGEVSIRSGAHQTGGQISGEIQLTILSPVDMPSIAEEELCRTFTGRGSHRGLERALEVLRRYRGQASFRRDSQRKHRLSLFLPTTNA